MHDLLSAIVACARATVATRRAAIPEGRLEALAARRSPRGGLFIERIGRPGSINVIAECKRRSPAKGVLRRAYHPDAIANVYETSGAAAISVLTEPAFFDGDLSHLQLVRDRVTLPVLRKDFVVDEYQLLEARAFGADAVLLIVAALGQPALEALLAAAGRLGLAALVEVHDRQELDRAVAAGAAVVGVNCRDLRTLQVDTLVFEQLAAHVPAWCVAVAESGIRSPEVVRSLRASGYRAFLVGEWLMTGEDPGALLRDLVEAAA